MHVFNRYDKPSSVTSVFEELENPNLRSSYRNLYKRLEGTPLELFLLKTCQFYPEYEESLKTAFIQSMNMSTFLERDENARMADLWHVGANVNDEVIRYMRDAMELLVAKLNTSDKYYWLVDSVEFKEVQNYVQTTSNVFYKIYMTTLGLRGTSK